MARIIKEKLVLADKALKDYFSHSHVTDKTCKKFDPNLMSAYIKKQLEPSRQRDYEKHLFHCAYCMKVYTHIENEIDVLMAAEIKKVGEPLLAKALSLIEKEHLKFMKEKDLSKIVLRLKEKGMELIELLNFPRFVPVTMPHLRSGKEEPLLKEVRVENNLQDHPYHVSFRSPDGLTLLLDISFSKELAKKIQGQEMEVRSGETSIIKPVQEEMSFERLGRGNYQVLLDKKELFRIEVE